MKLKYVFDEQAVKVIAWKGEAWSEAEILGTTEFPLAECPDVLEGRDQNYSVKAYGLAKLLQDRTSQVSGAEDKLAAMQEYWDVFKAGKWRVYSERTGGKRALDVLLVQALAKLKKAPIAAVQKKLQGMPPEEVKALAALDAVQEAIAKLREEAEQDVDLSF